MGSNSREAAARLTDMDTGHSGPSAAVTEGLEEEALLDGELEEGELEDGELAENATEETQEESEATENGEAGDGSAADGSEIAAEDSEAIAEDSTEETAEGEEELTEEELAEAEALAAAAAGGHQGEPTAIITGSANVFINGLPAARQGDMLAPHHPGTRTITEGSPSVLINGMPAARVTDAVDCGGTIETGSDNVFIGNEPKLVPPTKVSLPDIEFKHRRVSFKPKAIAPQPPANTGSAQVDSVVYSANSHSNNTNVRVEPVANNLGSVAWVGDASAGTTETWGETYGKTLAAMMGDVADNQAELAKQTSGWGNVMQPLFKPIAGLGAAVGNTVGLLEGLSPHGLSPQVKNYWADQLASIKNVAKLISSAAKGDPTAAAQLTPAVITGLAFRKLSTNALGTSKTEVMAPPPLAGLHNNYDKVEVVRGSFQTTREVELDNLSEADRKAKKQLKKQGWDNDKIREVLSSGDNFQTKQLNRGDKLFGFDTRDRNKDISTSAYWLDEDEFHRLESQYFKEQQWDKEGIKNTLALPCYNRADSLTIVEIQSDTIAVQSTVGRATELISYTDSSGYDTGIMNKSMPGGGIQTIVNPSVLKGITH